jgi:hypothetical protein
MRVGAGAVLVPAVDTTSWEQGLACRVVLFRDWGWNDVDGNQASDVRIAEVVKAEGTAVPGVLVAFSVGQVCHVLSRVDLRYFLLSSLISTFHKHQL